MDRIANKPYLQARDSVPDRLRIMSIDVKEVRYFFDGNCMKHPSVLYEDSVAPPKTIRHKHNKSSTGSSNTETMQIDQKTLAKALIQCRKNKKIGVELLEASIGDLNPHSMRRVHHFQGASVDSNPNKSKDKDGTEQVQDEKQGTSHDLMRVEKKGPDGKVQTADPEDAIDAPWNQSAWIEEIEKRVRPTRMCMDGNATKSCSYHGQSGQKQKQIRV